MPQLSSLETTGASEEIIHLRQLWATTSFIRSISRLVSPASVKTIALQLQSNLLGCFQDDRSCQPPWVKKFRTSQDSPLLQSFLLLRKPLARPHSARLETLHHTCQLGFFERSVLRDARHVDLLTIVPIVVDSVVVVNVVVLERIGAFVPLIVV